jgi:hypothetical protein
LHIKNLGLAGDVHVQLACAEDPAPARLRGLQIVLCHIAGPGAGDIADVWVRAGGAAQLAVIFARLGHRELSALVASAAEVAVTQVHA